MTKNWIC